MGLWCVKLPSPGNLGSERITLAGRGRVIFLGLGNLVRLGWVLPGLGNLRLEPGADRGGGRGLIRQGPLFRSAPGRIAKVIRCITFPAYRVLGPVSSDSDRISQATSVYVAFENIQVGC